MKSRWLPLLFLAGSVLDAAADKPARPNIVFIFSDDHAWQALSAYGDTRKLNATPNIDRIAREGMRFDRCLVPNPICGPSRATVLTGLYSHKNGFVNNRAGARFDSTLSTFPRLLQAAGYQTAMIGKWHLGSDPVGFDFWQILPGQGLYYNPPMIRNGTEIKTEGYVTDLITDTALDWLKHSDRSKPFLLMWHHKAPHRPWEPALRHLGADQGRVYPEPDTLFDNYAGRGIAERDQDMTIARAMHERDNKLTPPPNLTPEQRKVWDAYYDPIIAGFKSANPTGNDLVRWKYQRYLSDYLNTLKSVDEGVGRLLDYLETAGLAENTLVVYSSDQGFFLGEHGWFDKRWIFEESVRTPLLVRWPGVTKPGSSNRNLVSTLDFAETFLDAAGVAVPAEMQGRSLVPILVGRTPTDWRTSFYYQYFEYPDPHQVRPHYGLVTERYKLVKFFGTGEDYTELFDRQTDPSELRNVAADPAYAATLNALEAELVRQRRDLQVPNVVPAAWHSNEGATRAH